MENIIEFGCIICIANDIELKFLSRLQKWVFNLWFEDWNFLSCKSMELGFNFRVIHNRDFESVIFKNLNLSKIKLLRSNSDLWSIRIGTYVQKAGLIIVGTDNIQIKWQSYFSKFASNQSNFKFFWLSFINYSVFRNHSVFGKNLWFFRLGNHMKFSFEIRVVFNLNDSSFRIIETSFSELNLLRRHDLYIRNLTVCFYWNT